MHEIAIFMEQLIIGCIIIMLGMFLFKTFPFQKKNVKLLTVSAIFIVITLIAKRFFTFMIPLFGLESLKVGVEYIPLMIAGFILPPSYAYLVGMCCDLVGLILVPSGFPFFGFTLTMILVCVIPSLVSHYFSKMKDTYIYKIVCGIVGIFAFAGGLFIYTLKSVKISSQDIILNSSHKLILIGMCVLLVLVVFLVMAYAKKKQDEVNFKDLSCWILSVVMVEGFTTLILSPLWLDMMYNMPFIVSFCIRVIKLCFVIPIEIFVGYTVLKVVKRVTKF